MKQQAITNYDDALRNVRGSPGTWESTGRDGDGAAYFALPRNIVASYAIKFLASICS